MSKKKKVIIVVALVILMLVGIALMAYPYFAAKYNEKVYSLVQTEYQDLLDDPTNTEEIEAVRQAAIEYNHKLYSGIFSPLDAEENGYFNQLKVSNSDIMCFICIPAIDVSLPVYHGIGEAELSVGAGHMAQSSLPVGGENTHCVISAHSGMASSAMFTDIGVLEEGDLVYIDVLGETLTYKVTSSEVVLPADIEAIKIQQGKDLLTLVTCTPININTHRLLVHCERTETVVEEESPTETVEEIIVKKDESIYGSQYLKNICFGLLVAGVIILIAILVVRKKGKTQRSITPTSNR